MSEEEIKKIAREEMLDTIKSKLDSSMIFTYINNLEQENKQLKELYKREKTKNSKALHKLKSSVNHFRTQRENNAVLFTIRILEGKENE